MAEDFKDPKDSIGKITKNRPAVVQKLNSKDADIYEAKETSFAKLRESDEFKLALWCESMEDARAQAKKMNERVAFGRPKVSKTPGNPESGREWAMPKQEEPGTPIRQNHDYKIKSAASSRLAGTKYLLAVNSGSLKPIAPSKISADLKKLSDVALQARVALVHKTGGTVAKRLYAQMLKAAAGDFPGPGYTGKEDMGEYGGNNIMSNECKTCGAGPIPENKTHCPKCEGDKVKYETEMRRDRSKMKDKMSEPLRSSKLKADDSINPVPPVAKTPGVPERKGAPAQAKAPEAAGSGFAQDLKKFMDSFDKARQAWVKEKGSDAGFNEFLMQQMKMGGTKPEVKGAKKIKANLETDILDLADDIASWTARLESMHSENKAAIEKLILAAKEAQESLKKSESSIKAADAPGMEEMDESRKGNTEDFPTRAKAALAEVLKVPVEEVEEGREAGGSNEEGGTIFTVGGEDYCVWPNYDAAEEAALSQVRQDLENEPEIFNQEWLMNYMDASDLDKRMTAQDLADSQTEGMDESDLQAEADRRGLEIGTGEYALQEAVNSAISDEIEEQMMKPGGYVDYLLEQGLYSDFAEIVKNGLIRLWGDDLNRAADDAVSADGAGHFLSSYDGELHELPGGMQYVQR